MDTKAEALAQALFDSGEPSFVKTYTVPDKPDESIAIIALRGSKTAVKEFSESVRAVPYPSGQIWRDR